LILIQWKLIKDQNVLILKKILQVALIQKQDNMKILYYAIML
jgi:hypothetical protein